MKLYGFAGTRSQRALWGLKELDADFEFISVNLLQGEHKRPEFLRLNPAGKVPVLVDAGIGTASGLVGSATIWPGLEPVSARAARRPAWPASRPP